jgi:ketosteroid isomerase-like protein
MKRVAIAVCVVLLVFAVAIIAQTPAKPKSGSVEQELIKLENEWGDAVLKKDIAFLERIYAEGFIFTDEDGVVWTGAQDIANLKSGDYVYTSFVSDNMKVHVYGDTAIVFGRNTIKGQYKGKDISGQSQWTDTWIKRSGRWQCVATHSSRIAQK